MKKSIYISVIIPLKLEWIPCYSVPEGMNPENIHVGERVKVMFSNRRYTGVVRTVGIEPELAPERILPIMSVEHGLERILPKEIELWETIAQYYLCSIGEVYKAAYPERKTSMEEARAAAKSKVRQRREKMAEAIKAKISKLEGSLEKKREALEKEKAESRRKANIKAIEKLGSDISLARKTLDATARLFRKDDSPLEIPDVNISLSMAQNTAYSRIKDHLRVRKPVLLNGVTGSGKTEIYMKLAYETLKGGKDVLYLVPEIALSRQLEDRLYEHFGDSLMVFHSRESDASRRNTAETIRELSEKSGNYIVLGTGSSIFLPHHDLGLIIVDEEHDTSYKMDSSAPRYNGRDTALMLSTIHDCGIVLGSATPSLEEMYNCKAGRHALVELLERYHNAEDSDIEIIDTKAERRKNGMVGNFSRKLIEHINEALERGGQVIILRSRRAWAPVMQCESCGEIVKCPHCNVSLSHHRDGRMTCHYCGHTETYSGRCGKCGGALMSLGAGTQKIEEEAAELFPNAGIARLDGDTVRNKTYEKKTIRDFSNGDIDILIGTQIVTKGFDFSSLSLVAVIAADALLGIQDFRADEKAIQLLEQFRGRCGRRGMKGLLAIQTSQPEHPVYQRLLSNDTAALNMNLLLERKDFNFPPFTRIIEITVKDIYEDRAVRMASGLGIRLRQHFDAGTGLPGSPVTGPYSPAVDKIADNHIRSIRISLKKDRNLTACKAAISGIVRSFEKEQKYDGHIIINVDPA